MYFSQPTQPTAPRLPGVTGRPPAVGGTAAPMAPKPAPAAAPAAPSPARTSAAPTPTAPPPAAPAAPAAPAVPPPSVPAAVAPAPAGPAAPGPQAAAAPIATPPTAASQPLEGSPWSYERMWGALGSLGDANLDAAVKGATMEQLNDNPFSKEALAAANVGEFEKGMADLQGTRRSLDSDLIRRGMFSGGLAGELGQEAEMAARAGISSAQRQNSLDFAEKGAAHKAQAIQQAQSLAKDLASRGVDLENLRMQRESLAQQMAARGGGGGGGDESIEIVNPDGSVSTIPLNVLDLVLGMEEGGRE